MDFALETPRVGAHVNVRDGNVMVTLTAEQGEAWTSIMAPFRPAEADELASLLTAAAAEARASQ